MKFKHFIFNDGALVDEVMIESDFNVALWLPYKVYSKFKSNRPNIIYSDLYPREDGGPNRINYGNKLMVVNGEYFPRDDEWFNLKDVYHNLNGPALIEWKNPTTYEEHWFIRGIEYTEEINEWIEYHNIADWQNWNEAEKLMFQLRWAE